MKRNKILLLFVLALTLFVTVACTENGEKAEDKTLTISAAASLTDVMEELKEEYIKENPNIDIDFTFDSSGTLQSQIEEGAPVDIFFSAAEKQMDALEEKDLILKDTRKSLLVNKVVLITQKGKEDTISDMKDLVDDKVNKLAIGDPEYVPVGQYTEEILETLGIRDELDDKLVLGNNVRTVLSWVENGEVDYGLVYATDAFTSDDVEIVLEVPEDLYKKVSYPVSVVANSENVEEAKDFLEFLYSPESKEAFESYGFKVE